VLVTDADGKVWTFTHKDMPQWRAWESLAATEEGVWKTLEAWGRTRAMGEAGGLIPVQVHISEVPERYRPAWRFPNDPYDMIR